VLYNLARGMVLTRAKPRDCLAVKNGRLGEVLLSLESAGRLSRTAPGWQRLDWSRGRVVPVPPMELSGNGTVLMGFAACAARSDASRWRTNSPVSVRGSLLSAIAYCGSRETVGYLAGRAVQEVT
jgi:hypothetical protein